MSKKRVKSYNKHPEKITPANLHKHLSVPAINADEISHTNNVVSGSQNIAQQFIMSLNSEEALSALHHIAYMGRQSVEPKSPLYILPQSEIPFFTGREDELQQLEKLLPVSDGSRTARVMGVTGTGGMGKSALVLHFAKMYHDRFRDGVIGLQVEYKELTSLAKHLAKLVGEEQIDPEDKRNAVEIMQSAFQHKQALLIFDDVVEPTADVLLSVGKQCAVIVTTRNRGLLDTFGISNDERIDLKPFPLSDTKRLLQKKLSEAKVTHESEAIQEIHEMVGGLPLALSIVGSALNFITFANYRELLRNEKERLSQLYVHNPNDPKLSVQASFNISYDRLSEKEKILFACLGVCASEGFTYQIAEVVSGLDKAECIRGLGHLCSLSLVDQRPEPDWYALHPLLSLFAREKAEKLRLLNIAEQRHSDYYCRYAQLHSELTPANMDALERELDALLLTAYQLNNNLTSANNFYRALEPFLTTRGHWREALALIDLFLRIARDHRDLHSIAQFLLQRGQFLLARGEFNDAEQELQESKRTAWQIENEGQRKRSLAMILNELGIVYQRRGEFDQAADFFKQSLRIEEETGNMRGQSRVLTSLAGVLQRQGKFKEAEDAAEESYELRLKSDNKLGQAMALNSRGRVYLKQGKYDEAEKVFLQSYQLRLELDDKFGQAMVLTSLGTLGQKRSNYGEAIETFQRALTIEEEIGHRRGQAMVLTSLGGAYRRLKRYDKAVEALQRALAIEQELENRFGHAMVWNELGNLYQRQGNLPEAEKAFEQSYNLRSASNDEERKAWALKSWGQVLLDQNKTLQAMEKLKASFAILETLLLHQSLRDIEKTIENLRTVTSLLVRSCKRLDRMEEAREHCRRALLAAPNDRELLSLQKQLLQE